MARAGWPMETIRAHFSKHVSEPMLVKYLSNGRASLFAANIATAVTWWASGIPFNRPATQQSSRMQ